MFKYKVQIRRSGEFVNNGEIFSANNEAAANRLLGMYATKYKVIPVQ